MASISAIVECYETRLLSLRKEITESIFSKSFFSTSVFNANVQTEFCEHLQRIHFLEKLKKYIEIYVCVYISKYLEDLITSRDINMFVQNYTFRAMPYNSNVTCVGVMDFCYKEMNAHISVEIFKDPLIQALSYSFYDIINANAPTIESHCHLYTIAALPLFSNVFEEYVEKIKNM